MSSKTQNPGTKKCARSEPPPQPDATIERARAAIEAAGFQTVHEIIKELEIRTAERDEWKARFDAFFTLCEDGSGCVDCPEPWTDSKDCTPWADGDCYKCWAEFKPHK
jgi:hypothetical protein